MINQISREEIRSAIEDKLCAQFSISSNEATDEQIFQAAAIVIRELMSRLLAVEDPRKGEKEVHYMSMEFLMGRSLMKNAYNLGVADAIVGALEDMGRSAADIRGPAGRPAFSGRRDFTASLSVMRRAFTSSSTHRLAAAPICRPEASRNTFARG